MGKSAVEMQGIRQWSPSRLLEVAAIEHPFVLLTSLFVCELSVLIMALTVHVNGDHPLATVLSGRSGLMFLSASGLFCLAAVVIARQYMASQQSRSNLFRMTVAMNLIMVFVVLMAGEVAVRFGTTSSSIKGEQWRWRVLLPRSWEQVASSTRQLLEQGADRLSFLVYDDLMGWTTGPNKRSSNGLYYSSWEGIRASHEGVSYPKVTERTRIALVGDSFTFADDVAYEDSWGYQLEKALGSGYEVLNFGVSGYGIDQAFLRYQKDVRRWNPTVVIFGLISNDVERTMTLYHALSPDWWGIPFSKPRFILQAERLQALNVPPLMPQDLFSRGSIIDVPFIEYDRGYRSNDWQSTFLHRSYLARAILTLFPRWEAVAPEKSDEAMIAVNASILQSFVQSARSVGTIPLVVFFPEANAEFAEQGHSVPIGIKVLKKTGLGYVDLTPCLNSIPATERFVPRHSHYSAQTNAKVAQCLAPVVKEAQASLLTGTHHQPL